MAPSVQHCSVVLAILLDSYTLQQGMELVASLNDLVRVCVHIGESHTCRGRNEWTEGET